MVVVVVVVVAAAVVVVVVSSSSNRSSSSSIGRGVVVVVVAVLAVLAVAALVVVVGEAELVGGGGARVYLLALKSNCQREQGRDLDFSPELRGMLAHNLHLADASTGLCFESFRLEPRQPNALELRTIP